MTNSVLPTEGFMRIMKFLLGFVQKERQSEALVSKFCARIEAVEGMWDATEATVRVGGGCELYI
jgi:hypothetical protein